MRSAVIVMAVASVAQAAPPTVSVPCVTFSDTYTSTQNTKLVSDGQRYAVCWDGGACHDGEQVVARPGSAPAEVATRVEATRICTGDRCDPLGPRARAALAQGRARATRDRAMLVIGEGEEAQIWARAADRRVVIPAAHRGIEGEVVDVEVLADHVLVSRRWTPEEPPPPPWASGRGVIVDAKGAISGRIATAATSRIDQTRTLRLDGADVVFNGAGGFAVIVRGAPVAFGDLAGWEATPAKGVPAGDPMLRSLHAFEIPVHAVALPVEPGGELNDITGRPDGSFREQGFAYEWCSPSDAAGCRVGEIHLVFRVGRRGEKSYWLRRTSESLFPVCRT